MINFKKTVGAYVAAWAILASLSASADDLSGDAPISTYVGKSKLIQLTTPVSRVAVGDPNIADYKIVSPSELFVLGKAVGTTNIILWQRNGKSTTLDMSVSVDVAPLEKAITKQLPQEKGITVSSASGSIVLGGYVSDAVSAETVVNLAEAHVRNLNRYLTGGFKETSGTNTAMPNATTAMVQIVNLMKVRDPQQVMLEVRVAEISKKLLDQLGVGFNATSGDVRWNVISNFPRTGTTGATGATGLLELFPNANNKLTVDAQHIDSLVKILAEPNIVASSGQEGSFLVGGRIFIPVTQSAGVAGSVVTLVEREYGVGLKFVPTVLDGGRISLKVAPEVSEFTNATAFQSSKENPVFTTRRASTTVQLKNGEHLVIGGLMRNNVTANVKAVPVLGQLPILGALFRSTEYTSDKTELVIVVSPSLVKATPQAPELPTDKFVPPSRSELFIGGKLEGNQ